MPDTTPQERFSDALARLGHGAIAEAARQGGMSRRSIESKRDGVRPVREWDVWALERFEQLRADQRAV